jgi:hypothetical protein
MVSAARVLVLITALSIIALGLLVGPLGILASFLDPSNDTLILTTVSLSVMALGVGLGSALAWQAWQAIQGRSSRSFRPRWAWALVPLFLLAVFLGQLVLSLDLLPALTFPPFHVAAALLPPLFVVALASQILGGVTRGRDLVLQISSGTFVSTFLAFSLEAVFVLAFLAGLLLLVTLQPGGLEQIQALADRLQDPAWLQDPAELAPLASSPLVLASIFFVFALVVPLIEELVKTVGVPLLAYRRPNLSQAYLWGLAGGAGFALAEGLFNTASGLDAWGLIVLLRVGATLLHCFTGALMGLAWYAILIERRWGRAVGLYAASVGIHGLWNAVSATITLVSLGAEGAGASQLLSGTVVAFLALLLVLLALASGLALVGLAFLVRKRTAAVEAHAARRGPPPPEIASVTNAGGDGP